MPEVFHQPFVDVDAIRQIAARGEHQRRGQANAPDAKHGHHEGLGINLAICLSLLFYEGSDSGQHRGSGILLMALDEAERLDERAMNTVRDLLDRVECQLVLALPRMLNIPDSLTHILTPLPQGVTHVGVYHAPGVEAGGDRPEDA